MIGIFWLMWSKKKKKRGKKSHRRKKGNRKSESSSNQFPLTEFSFHNAFQARPSVRIDLKRSTVTEYPRCFISITFSAIIQPIRMKILRITGQERNETSINLGVEKRGKKRSRLTNWYLM